MNSDYYYANKNIFCNNCRKYGHLFNKCKSPITSYGVILFRKNTDPSTGTDKIEYLLIRRKQTLGFIDFIRGKYSVSNRYYIMNMLKQMTREEKRDLMTRTFEELWAKIWNSDVLNGNAESLCSKDLELYQNQHRMEENTSQIKFNQLCRGITISYNTGSNRRSFYTYNLKQLIQETTDLYGDWEEPEWGFPKGRRNYQENEYECAMREFTEETGVICDENLKLIHNLFPLEEIFIGSNYRSYKHKYFLTYQTNINSKVDTAFVCSEVSKMEWKTLDEALAVIRPYNTEKRELIRRVESAIRRFYLV